MYVSEQVNIVLSPSQVSDTECNVFGPLRNQTIKAELLLQRFLHKVLFYLFDI